MINRLYEKIQQQNTLIERIVLPETISQQGSEVAPRYKASHTENFSIYYDDVPHLYFMQYAGNIRVPLLSVTTIIGLYTPEFNTEYMSLKCAEKPSYSCECLDTEYWPQMDTYERQVAIKDAWEQNSKNASYYGTVAHAAMETSIVYPQASPQDIYKYVSQRFDFENEVIVDFVKAFITQYRDPLIAQGYELIAEPLVWDASIMGVGQSDIIAVHHEKKIVHILDHKSNKENPGENRKAYDKMLHGLNYMPSNHLNHYGLQLSLYLRFFLLNHPGYTAGTSYILWLNRDTGKIERVPVKYADYKRGIDVIYDDLTRLRPQLYGF